MFIVGFILLFIAVLMWAKFKPQDEFRVTNGPKLTPEEQKENYRQVRTFIEAHPNYEINKEFPEYLRDIDLSNRYKDLDRRLAAGEIPEIDYQIELDQLTRNIPLPK